MAIKQITYLENPIQLTWTNSALIPSHDQSDSFVNTIQSITLVMVRNECTICLCELNRIAQVQVICLIAIWHYSQTISTMLLVYFSAEHQPEQIEINDRTSRALERKHWQHSPQPSATHFHMNFLTSEPYTRTKLL